jgi:hypothetical protein
MRRTPHRALALFAALTLISAAAGRAAEIVAGVAGCTLADAIRSANNDATPVGSSCAAGDLADVIVLAADETITAAEAAAAGSSVISGGIAGLPDVTSTITLRAGAGDTIERDPALGSCSPGLVSPFRLLNVPATGWLTLEGITLRGGCIGPAAPTHGEGGAVIVNGGRLTIVGGSLTGNRVRGGDGSGVAGSGANGGAIAARLSGASVTLTGTSLSGNSVRAGDSDDQVFQANGGAVYTSLAAVTINDCELSDNLAIGGSCPTCTGVQGSAQGGALYLFAAPATVADTTFSNNAARGGDAWGGNASGGAINWFSGTGTLERLLVLDNEARGGPGSGGVAGSGEGGGLRTQANGPVVRDSLFRGNVARGGAGVTNSGGGRGGGVYWLASSGQVTGSTFLDNVAEGADDGAVSSARGGGLELGPGSAMATLANCTIVGNVVRGGSNLAGTGGNATGGGLESSQNLPAMTHVTVWANDAIGGEGATPGTAHGGGLYVRSSTLSVDNSILAGNRVTPGGGTTASEDCFRSASATLESDGYNFVQAPDPTCTFATAGDSSGDPALLPVAEYGCAATLPDGSCMPLAPLSATSPAVDAGSCVVSELTVDQRGVARPADVPGKPDADDGCDPGAFELQPGAFHAITPCRLFDSREVDDAPILSSGATRVVDVAGPCGVAALASAVSLNATVTAPTAGGHLTLYPADGALPATSTLNFSAGQTRANNTLLSLSATGTLAARVFVIGNGQAHLILDVNGWFE